MKRFDEDEFFEDDGGVDFSAPLDPRFVLAGLSMLILSLAGLIFVPNVYIRTAAGLIFFASFFVMTKNDRRGDLS